MTDDEQGGESDAAAAAVRCCCLINLFDNELSPSPSRNIFDLINYPPRLTGAACSSSIIIKNPFKFVIKNNFPPLTCIHFIHHQVFPSLIHLRSQLKV
jgi:hypothetical protein